jgi:two-component system CheB/CheR fusion protein
MDLPKDLEQGDSDRRRYAEQLRILVVDDDPDTVNTLCFILRDEGYVVQAAHNGEEGLSRVRVFRPDVIIHDIAVPGISGYAAAQALRYSFPDVRRPLMIAISGFWTKLPDRKVAEQMGFDEYLAKPCDPAVLLDLVARFKRSRARNHQ